MDVEGFEARAESGDVVREGVVVGGGRVSKIGGIVGGREKAEFAQGWAVAVRECV